MPFAQTTEGFEIQTIDEILAELSADLRAATEQPNLDLSSTSPLGQVLGVMAEREYNRQLVTLAVYNSRFPSRATGDALTQAALITGTIRHAATRSAVGALVTLTAGTTLPAGSRANVAGDTTAVFETSADFTNTTAITDEFAIPMIAVNTGPIKAIAATLTVINTPVSGWESVTNPADAELGQDIEKDPALRIRRELELRSQGATTIGAIVADVREVPNVLDVIGFENKTPTDGVNDLPPHSFEIVVWDGDVPDASDNAIAQAIFEASPAGIQSAVSHLGVDSSGIAIEPSTGTEFPIEFSRALPLPLYVSYNLTVDGNLYPVDGDTQVKTAVTAYVNSKLAIGDDVIATTLYCPVYQIPGVVDVASVTLGFSASPTASTNLTVASRSIARADSSRITVSSTPI